MVTFWIMCLLWFYDLFYHKLGRCILTDVCDRIRGNVTTTKSISDKIDARFRLIRTLRRVTTLDSDILDGVWATVFIVWIITLHKFSTLLQLT
jgi:hypothetical protein